MVRIAPPAVSFLVVHRVFSPQVNTASRMESGGEPGRIQVTAVTAELLRAEGYAVESRGIMQVQSTRGAAPAGARAASGCPLRAIGCRKLGPGPAARRHAARGRSQRSTASNVQSLYAKTLNALGATPQVKGKGSMQTFWLTRYPDRCAQRIEARHDPPLPQHNPPPPPPPPRPSGRWCNGPLPLRQAGLKGAEEARVSLRALLHDVEELALSDEVGRRAVPLPLLRPCAFGR